MSLVTIIATEDFLSVMSDGRVTYFDEKISSIVYENFFKILHPTSDYFVSFTGDLTAIETFNETSGILTPGEDLKSFAQTMHQKLMEFTRGEVYVNYAIGGKNKRNEIEFFIFNTYSGTVEHSKPDERNTVKFKALISENVEFETLAHEIAGYLGEIDAYTPESAVQIQEKITQTVAGIDSTVNTNTFHIIIRR